MGTAIQSDGRIRWTDGRNKSGKVDRECKVGGGGGSGSGVRKTGQAHKNFITATENPLLFHPLVVVYLPFGHVEHSHPSTAAVLQMIPALMTMALELMLMLVRPAVGALSLLFALCICIKD